MNIHNTNFLPSFLYFHKLPILLKKKGGEGVPHGPHPLQAVHMQAEELTTNNHLLQKYVHNYFAFIHLVQP